jgi:hypothetical protein
MTYFRAWARKRVGVLLAGLILVVLSPILTDIAPKKDVPLASKILLVVGTVSLAIYTAASEIQRIRLQKKADDARVRMQLESDAQRLAISQRATLLKRVSIGCSEAMRDLRSSVRQMGAIAGSTPNQYAVSRQAAVKGALRALCDALDTARTIDADPLKAVYFKATVFEFEAIVGRQGMLRRKYWHYPDTIAPRTASWSIDDDSTSACVIAYVTRQEVVLPRVAAAAANGTTWKDAYAHQRDSYAQSSMVCVPIFSDSGHEDGVSSVLGVLTVDTNQLDYFLPGENDKALRNEVFGPFLGLIRLAYSVMSTVSSPNSPAPISSG